MSKKLEFKTNVKCQNCVNKVKDKLDADKEIIMWTINLQSPDRVLTVEMEGDGDAEHVKQILAEAGYKADPC